MPEKTRVLVYTTAYKPFIGGSEIALEENIRQLPDIFFDVFTPRYRRDLSQKECSGNFCVHRVGLGFFPADKYPFPALGFLASLGALKKTDVIHVYQASFGGLAGLAAKIFFPKKKLIATLQEGKELNKQNIFIRIARNMILKKSDVITVISSYLKDYATAINKKAKIVLIPNGVDLNRFRPSISGDKHTIITVSRLVRKNGLGDLIKAMKKVVQKIPEAKLLIVGSGEEEKEEEKKLRGLVKEWNLDRSVEFCGEVRHEDTSEYLSKTSIFVRPSLSEGLGSAFLEAMASGLAVIGTPVGGIPDFLKDGETGLFCKPGNSEDIAEKIIKLMEDDDLRNSLAKNSRKLVEEKYDWEKISKEFEKLYARI
ncbi:MAG: glycosyltransferase family 4 protein [Candidatus Colwellbacteria bacterium]